MPKLAGALNGTSLANQEYGYLVHWEYVTHWLTRFRLVMGRLASVRS
jgi:hypothetical protein